MAKSFNDLPGAVQAVILATVAVALAAGLFFYGIPGVVDSVWGLRTQRDQLQAEVNKLKAENQKNQAVERERAELLNRIEQLKERLAVLRLIVPDEQATDDFVRMVYNTAGTSSIFMRTFVAQPLVQRDFYVEMPFNVRLDGTYYALLSFFDRLAREQRIVSVNVMNLTLGGPQGGGMGKYTVQPNETVGANCTVTTYFNRPEPPPQQARRQQAGQQKK
ncbi:MAG: type 4a pilus biogenesis protein PilO [Acidobacteria bacterium]|nr:type 4a pilus biogenesis protein PilO [Acidobacteriota bacterium]